VPASSASPPPPPSRHAALDWLRCLAIVAVVWHHGGPTEMRSEPERYLRSLLVAFDVPVFLFASGFLYFRPAPIPVREVGRRLLRVLVPYGVASVLVFVTGLRTAYGWGDLLHRLLTGSALGIYYYVFLIVVSIPLVWPLSRVSRRTALALAGAAHAFPILASLVPWLVPSMSLFWALRYPLHYSWAYFLTGWVAAAYLGELRAARSAWPAVLWTAGIAGVVLWLVNGGYWLGLPILSNGRAVYSLSVVLLVWLAVGDRPVPGWVLAVGRASLTIYLYHLFVVDPLRARWAAWPWVLSVPVLTLAGVVAPLAWAWLGRRLLGARARTWLG